MLWHAFKVIRGALIFGGFYLSGALSGLLILPVCSLLTRDPVQRMRRNQRVVTAGFRLTLDALRWCRIFSFDARTVVPGLPAGPVIIVANHPTTIDVVAVLAVYREACVVVKHKIWNDPLLRHLFRWCGHIAGGDGSMASNMRVLQDIKLRLSQGFTVVIFPEGTRSPPGGLALMQKGAFTIASTNHTAVLPVVITADPPALHKEAPWHALPSGPVDYRLRPLPLLPVSSASARKLQRDVTRLYREALNLDGRSISDNAP